ncbi:MAG: hypothetical protein ABIT20_09770 [Gemmatimonadaceae bacterium]
MKISHRMYLTVAPAILAVLLLIGLVYWGEYGRTAPELVIVVGGLAVLTSLVLTWSNARFVARRLDRIVGGSGSLGRATQTLRGVANAIVPENAGRRDEIDQIEHVVDRLSTAVQIAEGKSAVREKLFEQRAQDYARLLASIADASTKRLEEVRLPLHILLENRFGDLNENQEEMLGAARVAAEAADADMLSLRQIAELDLGGRPLRDDRMKPSDIIDAARPLLMAAAESAGATLEIDVAPLLPPITGDRAMLQEALVTILRGALASTNRDARARIDVDREGTVIRIVAIGVGSAPATVRSAAAVRVVQAHGGFVERTATELKIDLPVERSISMPHINTPLRVATATIGLLLALGCNRDPAAAHRIVDETLASRLAGTWDIVLTLDRPLSLSTDGRTLPRTAVGTVALLEVGQDPLSFEQMTAPTHMGVYHINLGALDFPPRDDNVMPALGARVIAVPSDAAAPAARDSLYMLLNPESARYALQLAGTFDRDVASGTWIAESFLGGGGTFTMRRR